VGNPWPFVVADFRRSRGGVVAVVLLMAVAVALGVAISAQERALRQGSARAADAFDLLIGAPGSETQLVLSTVYLQPAAIDLVDGRHLAELQDDPDVQYAAPIGFGDSYQGYPIVGTIAAFLTRNERIRPAEGRVFERLDEAVVGADVALELGARFVPTHGQVALDDEEGHEHFAYTVVGRMPRLGNPWDRAISAPIESVWWVHSLPVGHVVDDAALWPSGAAGEPELGAVPVGPPWDASELPGVPAIAVKPASFAAAYSLRQRYRAADDTMAVFPAEVLIQLYDLLGDVRDLVAALSLLTQVLVIGAVLLAVLATIALRRKSIAVLRALGASRPFVFATVWLNVALMLSVGAVLGVGLGYLGAIAVSAIFASRTGVDLPVALSWQEAELVLGIILIGLVLATIPAALAYRGSVSSALRA
jgi:putative ABC transport system permease protein